MLARFRWQALLLAAVLLLPHAVQAQGSTFFLSVVDGVRGQTFVHTHENSTFTVTGNRQRITVYTTPSGASDTPRYDDFTIDLHAPAGQLLGPGFYPDIDCPYTATGRAAGFEAYENNRPCGSTDEVYGWVTIRKIAFDESGAVTQLELAFSQRVGSPTAPALNGLVRFNTGPLSLAFTSGKRSLLGERDEIFFGDTALFELVDNGNGSLLYTASVLRALLHVAIDTGGEPLQVGRYVTHTDPGLAPVTMSLFEGEDPAVMTSCRGPGVLEVQALERDGTGRIVGLRATFEQYCGDRPTRPSNSRNTSVRGEIRYGL